MFCCCLWHQSLLPGAPWSNHVVCDGAGPDGLWTVSCSSAPGGIFRTIASGQLLGSVQKLLVTDVFISLCLARKDGPCVGQKIGRGAEVHSELHLTLLGEKSWWKYSISTSSMGSLCVCGEGREEASLLHAPLTVTALTFLYPYTVYTYWTTLWFFFFKFLLLPLEP